MSVAKTIKFVLSLGTLLVAATAIAQSDASKPSIGFTIGVPTSTVEGPNTPLWNKLKKALIASQSDNGAAFKGLLLPGAKAVIHTGGDSPSPFTTATIKAAMQSCFGPYLYDEGKTWLEFSWVCHVNKSTPLSRILTFRDSPELSVVVWYEGSRIKELMASEHVVVPGMPKLRMDAAEGIQK